MAAAQSALEDSEKLLENALEKSTDISKQQSHISNPYIVAARKIAAHIRG